jgi:Ca-activated chloride channel family protein
MSINRFRRCIVWLAGLCAMPILAAPIGVGTDQKTGPRAPYFQVTGDGGLDRFPMKSTKIAARLNGVIAAVHVTQVYRNQGTTPLNAKYIFPGSNRAAVNAMTMTIGERRIVARIREKEEAKQVFEAAKQAGQVATLLSQKRPNVFSMDVANIGPGEEATIELDYTEILTVEHGVYEFVSPGVVGPRYGGDATASGLETGWVSNPYLREGADSPADYDVTVDMQSPLAIHDLQSATHRLSIDWHGRSSATVKLDEPGRSAGNRDFILEYRLEDDAIVSGLSVFRFADENYFMLVAQPPHRVQAEQIPARDYIFVIDVSGSMFGFPLDTAKVLVTQLLQGLKPQDTFNILFFSGGAELLAPRSLPANPANVSRAIQMMTAIQGSGGTELLPALQDAFAMPAGEGVSRSVVVITDGYISAEDAAFRLVDENLGHSNLFAFGIGSSVNRFLIEGLARAGHAESFVVTDAGQAAHEAQRFREYIAAPVLTHVQVSGQGVTLYDLAPAAQPDLLSERPLLVLGKFRDAAPGASMELNGISGAGPQRWSFALAGAGADASIPQLWARKRLEHLYVFPNSKTDAREEILGLGLKYSLLTSATSFIAVDETARTRVAASKDVRQPLPLPEGVSDLAVGGEAQPMPEPEWALLASWSSVLLAIRALRRRIRRV